jgi:integrase
MAAKVDDRAKPAQKRRRGIELLTPNEVKHAGIGVHRDGGNLMLVVRPRANGQGLKRAWVFRYASPVHRIKDEKTGGMVGKRREMGLGSADDISLVKVRELARKNREAVALDEDPLDIKAEGFTAKQAKKKAEAARKLAEKNRDRDTLQRVVREYHEQAIEPHKTGKHAQQWLNSIEQHVPALLLAKPIEDVTAPELYDMLMKLRAEVRETSRRVAQRLGMVFADAALRGKILANPMAAIKPMLREAKGEKKKHRTNFASLPFAEVPGFVGRLHDEAGVSPLALEFLIRTAARTGEVIGATWTEVDLDAGVWTIPAEKMKAHEQHQVFLSPRAVEILTEVKKLGSAYCFPSPVDKDKPLSNMAMLTLMKRMKVAATVHGFRSSFSTWGYQSAARARPELARGDVIEACLAHVEANAVKAAYNRAKYDDDQRELLKLWSEFLDSKPAKVLDIAPGKARKARKAA